MSVVSVDVSIRSRSNTLRYLGLAAFVVGLVGYVALGWRFDSTANPIALGFALVAVAVAVVSTLRRR
ncbi:hypothetical protein [Halomarina pelagica]|uniref:hypothetical protein n=1 Tax=Halomarina pelagica TaxID=2961599 RepID=UPI0020C3350A|nr:hypothetical protein [Halomarina sp. BND7]